jgi:hypothetical protein
MDDIIKGMFMWNMGRGNEAINLDLTQGIGLAILSQVIGIKQIEEEMQVYEDEIEETMRIPDLKDRLEDQEDIHKNVHRMVRKTELLVSKKY